MMSVSIENYPGLNGLGEDPTVRAFQQNLARLGFDPGPIDGVWGAKTRSAMQAYQKAYGLSVTAEMNDRTITQAAQNALVTPLLPSAPARPAPARIPGPGPAITPVSPSAFKAEVALWQRPVVIVGGIVTIGLVLFMLAGSSGGVISSPTRAGKKRRPAIKYARRVRRKRK